jgi:hypothetical protein
MLASSVPLVNAADAGTNPSKPDTDGDGLLDGTEVDSAMGTERPNPTDDDSHDDMISDGDELAGGTNPCDSDPNGDGLPDNVSPTPTTPGAPTDFLEELARELAAHEIPQLDLGQFTCAYRKCHPARLERWMGPRALVRTSTPRR